MTKLTVVFRDFAKASKNTMTRLIKARLLYVSISRLSKRM
jgi:hypothetical protein